MGRRISTASLIALLVALLVSGCGGKASAGEAAEHGSAEERPPNVLFILVDDLGYMDIGAYNPDTFYETPHVDSLAARGMTFTDGYAANPVCSPTRFSIMTGQYPSRKNRTNWFCGKRTERFRSAAYECFMEPAEVTLAEAFQEAGYATWFGGKWHLGDEARYWPEAQGFDENVGGFTAGNPSGFGGYFSPWDQPRLHVPEEGTYLPRHLASQAAAFIERHRDEPFFTYLSFYEVHTPKQAPDSLVAKYERKRERLKLNEVDEFEEIEQVWPTDDPRRARVVQGDPVYAAMVEEMDRAVGTVLEALRTNGVADNTVVVFMSDNGGLSTSEGQSTSNRPLRGGKGWVYEGGIREPFLIYWPGVTPAGATTDVPAASMDFYPTLLDIAGLPPRPEQHRDGVSLAPVLRGEASSVGREALYWHYPHYGNQGGFPGGAIRQGPWKLVEDYEDGAVQLFNLDEDLGEQSDRSAQQPERAAQMRQQLHQWYEAVGARFLRQKEGGSAPWRPGA